MTSAADSPDLTADSAATATANVVDITLNTGRSRVLGAAAALLVEQGYAATTLRQIASDVGIKAGSIYHHFSSKEELFTAVFKQGIIAMVNAFTEVTATSPSGDVSAEGQLARYVRAHLGALFEHGPFTAAHVTSFFTAPPKVRMAVVPARDSYESLWNSLLSELIPHVSDKDVSLHRLLLFGAMNTTIEWFDLEGNLTLDELAQAITKQFMHGVTE